MKFWVPLPLMDLLPEVGFSVRSDLFHKNKYKIRHRPHRVCSLIYYNKPDIRYLLRELKIRISVFDVTKIISENCRENPNFGRKLYF